MEPTSNTPFKLPLWSEWTVKIKEKVKYECTQCNSRIPYLKELAIQSIFKYLKYTNRLNDLPKILQDNLIPPVLYIDVACLLFTFKQWSVLRTLISNWPYETFHLSEIIPKMCPSCWLSFLESEDVDDPEKEGGDTERQLFRKVFKHVLDGFFFVVKRTLENEASRSPLHLLDLTLNVSQDIRCFFWEDEFRRLGRRLTKTLDVCILAGMHKKILASHRHSTVAPTKRTSETWDNSGDVVIDEWQPVEHVTSISSVTTTNESTFEISTWREEEISGTKASLDRTLSNSCRSDEERKSPEIGVWNGNVLDFSHLTEMPSFNITIDASVSEKSNDILTWIQQRYDEFSPFPSPISVCVRYLEVNLHEERKLESLMDRLPAAFIGIKFSEICENRSAVALASHIPRFTSIRFLDLGSCAFDLADHPYAVELMAFALSQLPFLERLSLAHNRLTDCLASLLSPIQQGLHLLDLSSCSLSNSDLAYLGESSHRKTLRALSLAANELACHWEQIEPFIGKLGCGATNLRILDISSNDFLETQLTVLSRIILVSLPGLSLLDLSWHELSLTCMVSMVELLASKTNLRTLCLSTPIDMAECGYDQPERWQVFVKYIDEIAFKHREKQLKPILHFHWCLI